MTDVKLLKKRRSYKIPFSSEPVDLATIKQLCENAKWAPSAHNRQPWRVIYVEPGLQREELVHRMGKQYVEDMVMDGLSKEEIKQRMEKSYQAFLDAPVLLVVFGDNSLMDTYPDEAREGAEQIMLVQSVANFTLQILLAATKHGLAGCWYCAPLFTPGIVCATLKTPNDWLPLAFVTLGVPKAVNLPPSPREPVDSFLFVNYGPEE